LRCVLLGAKPRSDEIFRDFAGETFFGRAFTRKQLGRLQEAVEGFSKLNSVKLFAVAWPG
jgi:hypothetical protein